MFNKSFLTVAAIFAITGPSLVSASPIAYSDALDTRAPFVTTRHCEGQKIVDHKKDEATGKVTKSTVQTCASGSECYTYGNGRVGCAKKQKRSEIDELDARAPFVTTRHCEGQKVVDHKKDEATGTVTKSTVQTCASGSECYTYGNGRVGCAKKQKRSEYDELDARAPFVTTRHCEGQKIVDHKKDEATGKVTKSTVQTCPSGSECYTYGNGRVGCAKKQ